ncbi:hypothetical protein B0H14DRAFT_3496509 [Mycena olivaceomarginata]|nr:hypothetical protein B0H14DRAFT_3496509 [Mycena olivaceomarginata]
MDPTLDIDNAKSKDRILRICYFSIGGDKWYRAASKGLFATLVGFETSRVSLAILQCTGIKLTNTNPPTYLDVAPISEISLPDTHYEITGQILSLVPFLDSSQKVTWAWTTDFVSFESHKAKQANSTDCPARMRHLSIKVNGRLVLPLPPTELGQATLQEILHIPAPTADNDSEHDTEKTWVFPNTQLDQMVRTLSERAQEEDVRLKIPIHGPVREEETAPTKITHCIASIKAPSPADGRRPCRICQKGIAGPDRQNHVGKHILASLRGIQEENLVSPVDKEYPCGFCGQSTVNPGTCTIGLVHKQVHSSCPDAYKFKISAALTCSISKPSTNAPISSMLCGTVHWKYNMDAHLRERHPNWELTVSKEKRDEFSARILISDTEELRLGITKIVADAAVSDGTPSVHHDAHVD